MIDVSLIPILSDNYAYLLEADDGSVAIVDPGEALPIIDFLQARDLKPDVILITHHHWDHVDGLQDMLDWHLCPVIGAAHPHGKPAVVFERFLSEGDPFSFGGETAQILDAPGHTPEHICFYFKESGFLLAGDVLFLMGCGRLLNGTADEMFLSLQKLKTLPDETRIYCGHEYTFTNAKFCSGIAPNNTAITQRFRDIEVLHEANTPTIPATLGLEKETNLFLQAESAEDFADLRKKRDNF